MNETQTIIWTALPNGYAKSGRLRLSVYVSPRLGSTLPSPGGMKLAQFPDLRNWPASTADLSFEVEVKGMGKKKAKPLNTVDSELWGKLFQDNTPVKPYAYKSGSARVIRSFPVKDIMNTVQGLYTGLAKTAPVGLPSPNTGKEGGGNTTLIDFVNRLSRLTPINADQQKQRDGKLSQLEGLMSRPPAPGQDPARGGITGPKTFNFSATPGGMTREEFAFMTAQRFYARPENEHPYGNIKSKLPDKAPLPDVDFHYFLTTLADYPGIMRRLGIVFDLEIEVAGMPAKGTVRVKPLWGSHTPSPFDKSSTQPWTAFEHTAGSYFRPAPRPGQTNVQKAMLRLDDKDNYRIVQIDPDSALFKTLDYASNINRMMISRSYETQMKVSGEIDSTGSPTLLSGGLSLVHDNRGYLVSQRMASSDALNAAFTGGSESILFADDVTRGYRVDVQTFQYRAGSLVKKTPWYSLCQRTGFYKADDKRVAFDELDSDSYVKNASGTSKDGSTGDLYLHETMFNWHGWSMVAAHPGRTIVPKTELQNRDVDEMGTVGGKKRPVTVNKAVPVQTEEITEVVNRSPAEVQFKVETFVKAKPGTLPRLRFGNGYRMRARLVDLAGNSEPLDSGNETNVTNEERYFRFDPVPPPAIIQREVVREGESSEHMVIRSNVDMKTEKYAQDTADNFKYANGEPVKYNPINDRHIVPPKSSQLLAELHNAFEEAIGDGKGDATYDKWWKTAIREQGNLGLPEDYPGVVDGNMQTQKKDDTIVVTNLKEKRVQLLRLEQKLSLPYLPDYLSMGAALRNLPGWAGGMISVPGAETGVLPHPDNALNKLNILKIPFHAENWPDTLPFRIQIEEGDAKPQWSESERLLRVFLPQAEDRIVNLSSYFAKAFLELMGLYQWMDAETRLKLEPYILNGQHWMFTPFLHLRMTHAVQQPLKKPNLYKFDAKKTALGQTNAFLTGHFDQDVKSTGRLELVAEWNEAIDDPADMKTNPETDRHLTNARPLEAHVHKTASDIEPIMNFTPNPIHEFGDTKYRKVKYWLIGTTRFREYFPPEITDDPKNITQTGDIKTVKVLSSARPAAPKVQYIVPTFGWDDRKLSPDGTGVISRRCGGGLRVYMDRGMYSSGDEELLGVLLDPAFPATIDDNLDSMKGLVTRWGMDPIWWGQPVDGSSPKPGDFLAKASVAEAVKSDLTLEEAPGKKVTVVGHPVHFDMDRKLWYCDINLDMGSSYFPFIRLALARYQPNSLPDAHLSRVVLTDFQQMAPDRVAGVQIEGNKLQIVVSGVYGLNRVAGMQLSKTEFIVDDKLIKASPDMMNFSRVFTATVEKYQPGGDTWSIVDNVVLKATTPNESYGDKMVWAGEVELKDAVAKVGDKKYRLLIQEYEFLPADTGLPVPPYNYGSVGIQGGFLGSRLVYADTIII